VSNDDVLFGFRLRLFSLAGEIGDLVGLEVVDTQRLALAAGHRINSPVPSIVSGRSSSERPLTRLLRPVA
jgi:hypothetical protein